MTGEPIRLGRGALRCQNQYSRPLTPKTGGRVRYLIDGYNLLHAMGVLTGRVGPHGLEKARLALLGRLLALHADDPSRVTGVFDAANPPPGAEREQDYKG